MKIVKSLVIGVGALTLLSVVSLLRSHSVSGAPSASPAACRQQIIEAMSDTHDEYRARVFGAREDADGKFSVLTGGFASSAQTGILETKERLSSELIEPVVESYRVLGCRMNAICLAMKRSFDLNAGTTITVKQLGCKDQSGKTFGSCSFTEDALTQLDRVSLEHECDRLTSQSMKTERSVLQLAFSYDSGYRGLLQLSGMIDWFQGEFPSEVLQPIRDMVNLLGKMHEVPCFVGQCDNPDISGSANSSSSNSFSSSSYSFSSSSSFSTPGL